MRGGRGRADAPPARRARLPLRFGPRTVYPTSDVFDVCDTLAQAEAALARAGAGALAARAARAFEAMEAGLARGARSGGAAAQDAGSNSIARELTQ